MKRLSRAPIWGNTPGVDITAKTNLAVAPSWRLVMDFKHGRITTEEYTERYRRQLEDRNEEVIKWALSLGDDIVFLCFCRDGQFCHTYLLIDWLIEQVPDVFERRNVNA